MAGPSFIVVRDSDSRVMAVYSTDQGTPPVGQTQYNETHPIFNPIWTEAFWTRVGANNYTGAPFDNPDATAQPFTVKVSSNDTTADFLGTKLIEGTAIDLTELNDGTNETLRVDIDINELTEDTSPDSAADFILTYDASATAHKKVKLVNAQAAANAAHAFSAYDSAGTVTSSSTTFVDIPLATEHIETSAFSHTGSSAEVTVLLAGMYLIQGFVTVQEIVNLESTSCFQLLRDTGSGYAVVTGASGRNAVDSTSDPMNTGSFAVVLNVTAGTKFKMQFNRILGTGTIQLVAGDSGLTITSLNCSVVGTTTPLPAVAARRSTTQALTTSYADIPFDITDIENATTTLEHHNTTTERIYVYETGIYLLAYSIGLIGAGAGVSSQVDSRIFKNGTTLVTGSELRIGTLGTGPTELPDDMSMSMVASLTAGDYITLQAKYATTSISTSANTILHVVKMQGSQGATGPPGPGSGDVTAAANLGDNLLIRGDGAVKGVQNSGITVSDTNGITGVTTLNVTGSQSGHIVTLRNNTASGELIQMLNQNGNKIFEINSGGTNGILRVLDNGVAVFTFDTNVVDIPNSTEGVYRIASVDSMRNTYFQNVESDALSTTTSTTLQTKGTLTTGTLPIGTYRLGWSVEGSMSTTTTTHQIEIEIAEGATVHALTQYNNSVASLYSSFSGFRYVTFGSAATHSFTIKYRTTNASGTAQVRRARLEIWRIS